MQAAARREAGTQQQQRQTKGQGAAHVRHLQPWQGEPCGPLGNDRNMLQSACGLKHGIGLCECVCEFHVCAPALRILLRCGAKGAVNAGFASGFAQTLQTVRPHAALGLGSKRAHFGAIAGMLTPLCRLYRAAWLSTSTVPAGGMRACECDIVAMHGLVARPPGYDI